MKKTILLLIGLLPVLLVQAQDNVDLSSNTVRYMLTHDAETGIYTAWVVPNYKTPNANNPESDDFGATAQFSLKVPRSFTLTDLHDKRGSWDKMPYKLTKPGDAAADNWAYYIIGKAPQETNYGPFVENEPVALFTFSGTGAAPEQIGVLTNDDRFVEFAEKQMALNVRNSFYSRSGQRAVASVRPLEQMSETVSLKMVLAEKQKQAGLLGLKSDEAIADLSLLAYPNPTTDVIEVKYFSAVDRPRVQIELVDMQGIVRQQTTLHARMGFNTVRLNLVDTPGGTYVVRAMVQGKQVIKKIVKR